MKWIDDTDFALEHPDLGTKVWTVSSGSAMIVKLKTDWNSRKAP